jgi:hypothetical protein
MATAEIPSLRDLTDDERRAIASLNRLAKRWPRTLTLVSMGGGLYVIRSDDERFHVEHDGLNGLTRADAIIDTILGIPNDGGDW